MENNSLFESKYDNEFIGLLNEIGLRFEKFNKCEVLKIKSWVNVLMMPCKTNIDKKNRNLYAILLINQMVNSKLEEPFIKFANSSNDLKQLSPANIKSQLSKKFYEEIDFEQIENYGYIKQAQFIQNHPNIANQIKEKNNTKNIESKINNKKNIKKPIDYSRVNNVIDIKGVNSEFMSKKAFYNKNYTGYNLRDYDKLMDIDNISLYHIIKDLEGKIEERDNIIEEQRSKLDELKNILNKYEKSLK
jgi:hypothetical protein